MEYLALVFKMLKDSPTLFYMAFHCILFFFLVCEVFMGFIINTHDTDDSKISLDFWLKFINALNIHQCNFIGLLFVIISFSYFKFNSLTTTTSILSIKHQCQWLSEMTKNLLHVGVLLFEIKMINKLMPILLNRFFFCIWSLLVRNKDVFFFLNYFYCYDKIWTDYYLMCCRL